MCGTKYILFFLINPSAQIKVKKVNGALANQEEEAAWKEIFNQNGLNLSTWQQKNITDDCIIYVINRDKVFDHRNDNIDQIKSNICSEVEKLCDSKNDYQKKIYVHYINCEQLTGQKCDNGAEIFAYTTAAGRNDGNALDMVEEIIKSLKQNNFSCHNYFNSDDVKDGERKLEEEAKKKREENNLTLLFHRIIHLFLPMDIDLMGISEVKEKKVEYLKDVFKDKDNDYYKKKLLDLAFYVAGIKNVIVSSSTICTSLTDDDLPGGKSDRKSLKGIVEEIIKGKQEQEKKKLENILKNIYSLAGINQDRSGIDTSSKIFQFMKLFDDKIKKGNNIQSEDVQEILNFFQKNGCWKVAGEEICSFHKWFYQLVEKLKSLRSALEEDKSSEASGG